VYCANGAPKESFVKITKAEDGGMGGKGLWRPVTQGLRPTKESDAMKQYLNGGFVEVRQKA
jgi:nitrate reductase alpha subunit